MIATLLIIDKYKNAGMSPGIKKFSILT